jgi:hypothetical protein
MLPMPIQTGFQAVASYNFYDKAIVLNNEDAVNISVYKFNKTTAKLS